MTATFTRTVGVADSAVRNNRQGYLSVSHLTSSASDKGARIFETYFVRGNILVRVTELSPFKSIGTTQDNRRRAVVSATLATLDAVNESLRGGRPSAGHPAGPP